MLLHNVEVSELNVLKCSAGVPMPLYHLIVVDVLSNVSKFECPKDFLWGPGEQWSVGWSADHGQPRRTVKIGQGIMGKQLMP